MSHDLYSVEQVASLLGLHVRTVRHYVREGRLKAVRIGKQYRIARADLEAFTGQPMAAPARRTRHVEVSSIVEVDAVDPETAGRLATGLAAAAKGGDGGQRLRIDTLYDPARARLKVIVTGGLVTTAELLKFANLYLESAS
jgi:excisionase family DNA binding protein